MNRRDFITTVSGSSLAAFMPLNLLYATKSMASETLPVILGTQYYRPPFPDRKYWKDDFARIADSGLQAVQLWIKWAWVEAEPDRFIFDDYDELVRLADQNHLKVVLSTICAIHPYWIHDVVPGSEMINNRGKKVVSVNRAECHYGLTPGGCIDHPGVWERMKKFLTATATRYKDAANIHGWDVWNELRWNVDAEGYVCYCDHSIEKFRNWLMEKYGSLEELNRQWKRRYPSWNQVQPGRSMKSPYTENMAFEHFISSRCNDHGHDRYKIVKEINPNHPVTVHGPMPTPWFAGTHNNTAIWRGNDWHYADVVDGIGTSSFPVWNTRQRSMDLADFIARLDSSRSASRNKKFWLSELQGGRAQVTGIDVHPPVKPEEQQRWVWAGIANTADTILFWCWRDEVFGRESSGFGLAGNDGFAQDRSRAMKKTAGIISKHTGLIASYKMDPPRTGLLFSPQTYYLHGSMESRKDLCMLSFLGYLRGMVRQNLPYKVLEEDHLEELEGLKLLFLPRTEVMDDVTAEKIGTWVKEGGTLFMESECGAFGSNGIYRYPEERYFSRLTGVVETGRRELAGDVIKVTVGEHSLDIPANQWITPFAQRKGEVWSATEEGDALLMKVTCGRGNIIFCGTYIGDPYYLGSSKDNPKYRPYTEGFEKLLLDIAHATGVNPSGLVRGVPGDLSTVNIKTGVCGKRKCAFIISDDPGEKKIEFPSSNFQGPMKELVSGKRIDLSWSDGSRTCHLPASEWGVWFIVEEN